MDQKKIGGFLKELRKEKGMTQEQLAEYLNVSGRTVSRWETGSNMPDLDILIQLADYYEEDIRTLLDGERKSEKMNKEVEETILKVADYSNQEKERLTRRMCILFVIGLISFMVFIVMDYTGLADNGIPLTEFLAGLTLGLPLGIMAVGILYTSGGLVKIKAFKRKLLNIK
ncbi:MAG: helix-turn-helix transcriptional regulator [Lachnospiraceae bacterium]|nr:helix-turn-helix transcriptional regulator [Lachnospiraceae bacterium]